MALTFGKINRAASFNPTTAFPLDARSYFESYDLALAAAQKAKAAGDTTTVYYYGETLAVVENGNAKLYVIQPDNTLTPVGADIKINENSFELVDGVLNLLGFANAVSGAQLVKTEEGKIAWVKPDATTVEGLQTSVSTLETNVTNLTTAVNNKADASTVYTKTEIDNSLTLKADAENVYTKEEADELLDAKANASEVYSKNEVNDLVAPLANKANSADVYTKEQTDNLVNVKANSADVYTKTEADTAIASAIANADHLKREIVDNIDLYEADASLANKNVIYMVKTSESGDMYKEYMRFDAEDGTVSFEQIGDTSVDLTDYVDSNELALALADKVNVNVTDNLANLIQANADAIALKAAQADLANLTNTVSTNSDEIAAIKLSLNDKASSSDLQSLQEIVNSKASIENLNAVSEIANKNKDDIALIQESLNNKANAEDLNSLTDIVNSKASSEELNNLSQTVATNSNDIAALKTSVEAKAAQADLDALTSIVDNKVEKVYSEIDGKPVAWTLLSPTDAAKLRELSFGEDGSVGISGTVAASKVEGLADWIISNRDSVSGLFSTEDSSKLDGIEAGANVNLIEAIKISGADTNLAITNKVVELPLATTKDYGLIKLSAEFKTNSDNAIEVNQLNVNKLIQTEDILFDCGNASGHTY